MIVEPWFEPGQMTDKFVTMVAGETEDLKVCRMGLTLLHDDVSTLEFEYLIARPNGIERRSERHHLGLFTQEEMEEAFEAAGLSVTLTRGEPRKRGLYVGRKAG